MERARRCGGIRRGNAKGHRTNCSNTSTHTLECCAYATEDVILHLNSATLRKPTKKLTDENLVNEGPDVCKLTDEFRMVPSFFYRMSCYHAFCFRYNTSQSVTCPLSSCSPVRGLFYRLIYVYIYMYVYYTVHIYIYAIPELVNDLTRSLYTEYTFGTSRSPLLKGSHHKCQRNACIKNERPRSG